MQATPTHSPFKASYRHSIFENSEEIGFVRSQTERGYLLKYYPKYYHKINLDKIDAPTIAKIKGLKRLHHFAGKLSGDKPHYFSSTLLQKVRKDLKTLPEISHDGNDSSHQRKRWFGTKFREVKYFSGVESIEVIRSFFLNPFEIPKGGLKNSEKSVDRIVTYLAHAKNLKSIETVIRYRMSEFLANVPKKLKRKLNVVAHLSGLPSTLSDFAMQITPFSQNFTQVSVSRCKIDGFKELATVIEALQDLKSLRIAANEYVKSCQIPEPQLEELNLNLYKALNASSKLEQFSLELCELVFEWLRNFALPKSLKTLEVNFTSSLRLFGSLEEECHSVLKNFCLRVQELPELNTLCLGLAYLKGDDPSRVWDFAVNLLQGIPRLSSLKLELPTERSGAEGGALKIMDCSLILEGIQHLMPVLQELSLDFSTWQGGVCFSPSLKYRFLNLWEVNIKGNISPPLNIKELLMMMMTMISEKDDFATKRKQKKVEIKKIMIKSREDSEVLLKNINHIDPFESHLELKLHVEFSEDLVTALIDFIKGIKYMKGLALYIWLKEAMRFKEMPEAIKDLHPRLDYVEVRDPDVINRDNRIYIFKKGVLIKRSNEHDDVEEEYLIYEFI